MHESVRHHMGIQCSRALSEPTLDWDLLFSWLELADLFGVHNLSCSLFLGCFFPLSFSFSLVRQPPGRSSLPPAKRCLLGSAQTLYAAGPGLNPLLKFLVRTD